MTIAIDDRKAEIFRGECAGEDDRDVPARFEHAPAIGVVRLAAAERQVIVRRELAGACSSARLGDLV